MILVLSFLLLLGSTADAEEISVESKMILVAEDELVELSARKKFDGLVMIMKELVREKIEDENEISLEEITISNFELVPQNGFKIYYYLD